MARQCPADKRAPSGRPSAEVRALEADIAELRRRLEEKQAEVQEALIQRNRADNERLAISEELKKAKKCAADAKRRKESATKRRLAIIKKPATKQTWNYHAGLLAQHIGRYDMEAQDIAHLVVTAMRKAEKQTGKPLRKAIHKSRFFKPALDDIHAMRDGRIHLHLRNRVYKEKVFAVMRHICKISKNECGLICQTFKWDRQADGTRVRAKLCPGSCFPAPLLFDPSAICEGEAEAQEETGVSFSIQDDRKGADIAGAPYSLDQAILGQLEATKLTRTGGMATAGTREDPHLLNA